MSEEKVKEEVLEVKEQQDGSVTVELPESMSDAKEAGDSSEERDDDNTDVIDDEDREAIRENRRARRKLKKELIKRTNEEKDMRLELLQRKNEELMERLSVLERKTHSSDLARLDKAIEDEELRLQYALAKMREAGDTSNGSELTKAQELWYETRNRVDALKRAKEQAAKAQVEPKGAANPQLMRHAQRWMDNNPWYDPQKEDEDSQIAQLIDSKLHKEGWDPNSAEYWQELDKRLQKRLPHLYNDTSAESERRRPKSFVTGSGRETAPRGGSTFVLEPEQVRAMKDAGFWDDPVLRNKMIKRYAEQSRNSRS